jgi:ribose 5-phosphate isomerase B
MGTPKMRIGIAADHGAFALKAQLEGSLRASGYEVVDFGAHALDLKDDSLFLLPEPLRPEMSSVG